MINYELSDINTLTIANISSEMDSFVRIMPLEKQIILLSALVSIIIIIIIGTYFKKSILQIIFDCLNISRSESINSNLYYDSSVNQKIVSILLICTFIINTTAFLFAAFSAFYQGDNEALTSTFRLYEKLAILIIIYSLFKYITIKVMGSVFDKQKSAASYLSNTFNYFKLFGLILFPMFLMFPFVGVVAQKVLIVIVLALFILQFTLRLVGGFSISFKIKLSTHYQFLYFCILELLPIVIIVNYFQKIM